MKDFKHCKLYNEFMYKNVNYEKNETRSNVCEDYKKFLKRVSDEKNESGKYWVVKSSLFILKNFYFKEL